MISRSFPVANTVTAEDQKTPSFEPHQRPLYFGHGNIDGLNFWSEEIFDHFYHGYSQGAYGRKALLKLENMMGGPAAGALQARFKLLAPARPDHRGGKLKHSNSAATIAPEPSIANS